MSEVPSARTVSPEALDYVQRANADPWSMVDTARVTSSSPTLRRMVMVACIGYPKNRLKTNPRNSHRCQSRRSWLASLDTPYQWL